MDNLTELETSFIKINQEMEWPWLKSLTLKWVGESNYVAISEELLSDNVINSVSVINLGDIIEFGPFLLKVVSLRADINAVLCSLANDAKKDVCYYGSVENEWDWAELEEI